jgi:hypothetical protein
MIEYNFIRKNNFNNEKIKRLQKLKDISLEELKYVLKHSKNLSAPGPSGITHEML